MKPNYMRKLWLLLSPNFRSLPTFFTFWSLWTRLFPEDIAYVFFVKTPLPILEFWERPALKRPFAWVGGSTEGRLDCSTVPAIIAVFALTILFRRSVASNAACFWSSRLFHPMSSVAAGSCKSTSRVMPPAKTLIVKVAPRLKTKKTLEIASCLYFS